jgi:predicted transcriptional regulator
MSLIEGTSTREKVCFQIQEFLLKKSANFRQIVEVCDVDKDTVSKYLDGLLDEGKIILKPKRKQRIEKYVLSPEGKKITRLLIEKQIIKNQIDKMSPQKFQEFKKFLDFMAKSKDGEEFLLHVPDSSNLKTAKKFKNLGTTILPKE